MSGDVLFGWFDAAYLGSSAVIYIYVYIHIYIGKEALMVIGNWSEIMDESIGISHSAITLRKGMTGLFNIGMATGLGEGQLWIQICLNSALKEWSCIASCSFGGVLWGKYI